ncbi:tyrosine-type recombinase/integrase [Thermodesulfobacteriota bacterium]
MTAKTEVITSETAAVLETLQPPTILPQSDDLPIASEIGPRELLEVFLSNKSERTIEAYTRDLGTFADFLGVSGVEGAARLLFSVPHGRANAIALAFRKYLTEEKKLRPKSVNRSLAALRSLSKMAQTIGLIPWTLQVTNQSVEQYRDTRGPGVGNFRKMLDYTVSRNDRKGRRDYTMLRLLFDLGLRRGEVAALDASDVDLDQRTIQVKGKGRTEKQVLSLASSTIEALRVWVSERGEAPGPLFCNLDRARKGDGRLSGKSLYRIVRDIGQKVGVKTWPHAIRHTAITQCVRKVKESGGEYGLEEILAFSRHKSVTTAMIYVDRERDVQGSLSELVSRSV